MSGICGILALDGGEPALAELDGMIAPLARRGPDGSHCWQQGPVAFGHTLLATTPEGLVEVLPLTDLQSGCTITADVRLDNRDELLTELGLAETHGIIGDGELMLRAYLRWGEECPTKLLGDFAFAIWDPRGQRLFCARDHMGMRQLTYCHQPGRLFAFATEAGAVVAHREVPRQINEGRIADFLDNLEGLDLTSTFFEGVHRLPPGHSLTVTAGEFRLRRYWRLRPPPELKLPSDEAYADAFLDVFTEAVRCRLRSAGPVGAMLSGGMDSGSVVAVAAALLGASARGPLQTFSAIGPNADACIETRTILSTAALPGVAAHFVNHAEMVAHLPALSDLPTSGEPFDFHMTLVRAVYLAAHQHGVKVVLDGAAGDVALTAGNRVAQLMRHGRFLAAIREGRREARFWGPRWPSWKTVPQAAWAALVPTPIRDLRRAILSRIHDRRIGKVGLVSAEFAAQINLHERRRQYHAHARSGRASDGAKRVQAIAHPHLAVARERYDRIASALAVEPRDPFIDVRVIEFCLSLPAEQLQSDGWPKLILRRAMRGLLPENVIWRPGKEHLGWAFTVSLFDAWPGWSEELEKEKARLRPFVRPAQLDTRNQPTGKTLDVEERYKLFFLLSWLMRSSLDRADAAPTSGNKHAEENA